MIQMETEKNFNEKLLNEVYTNVETGEEKIIEESPYDKADDSLNLKLKDSDVLRIEEFTSKGYSGVRGCGDSDTIKNQALAAMNSWVSAKMLQYRDLRWITYGHLGGSARWYNGTRASGARYCNGSVTIKCYIEFRKP